MYHYKIFNARKEVVYDSIMLEKQTKNHKHPFKGFDSELKATLAGKKAIQKVYKHIYYGCYSEVYKK